jgi:hypothetical protein
LPDIIRINLLLNNVLLTQKENIKNVSAKLEIKLDKIRLICGEMYWILWIAAGLVEVAVVVVEVAVAVVVEVHQLVAIQL